MEIRSSWWKSVSHCSVDTSVFINWPIKKVLGAGLCFKTWNRCFPRRVLIWIWGIQSIRLVSKVFFLCFSRSVVKKINKDEHQKELSNLLRLLFPLSSFDLFVLGFYSFCFCMYHFKEKLRQIEFGGATKREHGISKVDHDRTWSVVNRINVPWPKKLLNNWWPIRFNKSANIWQWSYRKVGTLMGLRSIYQQLFAWNGEKKTCVIQPSSSLVLLATSSCNRNSLSAGVHFYEYRVAKLMVIADRATIVRIWSIHNGPIHLSRPPGRWSPSTERELWVLCGGFPSPEISLKPLNIYAYDGVILLPTAASSSVDIGILRHAFLKHTVYFRFPRFSSTGSDGGVGRWEGIGHLSDCWYNPWKCSGSQTTTRVSGFVSCWIETGAGRQGLARSLPFVFSDFSCSCRRCCCCCCFLSFVNPVLSGGSIIRYKIGPSRNARRLERSCHEHSTRVRPQTRRWLAGATVALFAPTAGLSCPFIRALISEDGRRKRWPEMRNSLESYSLGRIFTEKMKTKWTSLGLLWSLSTAERYLRPGFFFPLSWYGPE